MKGDIFRNRKFVYTIVIVDSIFLILSVIQIIRISNYLFQNQSIQYDELTTLMTEFAIILAIGLPYTYFVYRVAKDYIEKKEY